MQGSAWQSGSLLGAGTRCIGAMQAAGSLGAGRKGYFPCTTAADWGSRVVIRGMMGVSRAILGVAVIQREEDSGGGG